jgi:cytochrome c biogenesis protein CcmG, thiol:disulfide interchange protein DsbE
VVSGVGCLGVLFLSASLHAQEEQIGIARGATPAAVTIEDLEGKPVDLAQHIGRKPVLIEFWATWCPLCEALFPKLETAARAYGDRIDVVVIAVAVNQSKRTIARHLERHPMRFARIYWDTNGKATRAFQAPSTSYIVALDATGKVVYTGLGDQQDIEGAIRRAVEDGQGRSTERRP